MKFRSSAPIYLSAALLGLATAVFASASLHAEQAPHAEAPRPEPLPQVEVPQAAGKIHEVYEIDRDGDKIGTTTIDVSHQHEMTTVKIATSISVKVMFIEAYHYEHSATETWKGGQLISYKSQTNDNGTNHTIEVGPGTSPDKLTLTVDGKKSEVAKAIAPASLWNKDIINRADLFQPDNGKRLSIKVKDLGEEALVVHGVKRQTQHYRISDRTPGEFDRDVWYDGDRLVRMKLLGSDHSEIISDLR